MALNRVEGEQSRPDKASWSHAKSIQQTEARLSAPEDANQEFVDGCTAGDQSMSPAKLYQVQQLWPAWSIKTTYS
jgi:hypothetical protein